MEESLDYPESHPTQGLRRVDLDQDPIRQFGVWFTEAAATHIPEVNAMSLATATLDGIPSVRIVLLKEFDDRGFVFFTNYSSEKGHQLEANPRAALALYWVEVGRQIRIAGSVERTSREESNMYFHSRPRGSQLGAWVSHQSQVIDARRVLDAKFAAMTQRFSGQEIPRPPHWGGYRVRPEIMEFWQRRDDRLHDRFRYTRDTGETWRIERLAP